MAQIKLIGIGGTNGSGKDTVGQMLAERRGWLFVSVSDFLRDEARRRGLTTERKYTRMISAEWRREFGLGVLVDKAVELLNQSQSKHQSVAAVPMRNPGEAQHVKDLGGLLIWVDADPKIRYQRIYNRDRGSEDKKTFEQFLVEEQDEMQHHGGDSATLNMAGVKNISDIFLQNNGNDIEKFKDEAEQALNKFI